jgi:hypothetical protein
LPDGSAVWEKSRMPWYLASFVAAMVPPTQVKITNDHPAHTIRAGPYRDVNPFSVARVARDPETSP